MSLRERLRRLLDAEARVGPLGPPTLGGEALDPLAGSAQCEMVEDAIRGLAEARDTAADDQGEEEERL